MEEKNLEKIVNFIFEVGTANNILRSHRQVIKVATDTIASHSFRTAIIGLILADLEKVDKNKIVKMCLLHDLAELRTGDANYVNKFYRQEEESKAIKEQWDNLPINGHIIELLKEYNERKSKESIVAKDADRLDQIFLQREYLLNNQYDLEKWYNNIAKDIQTESASKIAELAVKTNPLKWVYDFSDERKNNNNNNKK